MQRFHFKSFSLLLFPWSLLLNSFKFFLNKFCSLTTFLTLSFFKQVFPFLVLFQNSNAFFWVFLLLLYLFIVATSTWQFLLWFLNWTLSPVIYLFQFAPAFQVTTFLSLTCHKVTAVQVNVLLSFSLLLTLTANTLSTLSCQFLSYLLRSVPLFWTTWKDPHLH